MSKLKVKIQGLPPWDTNACPPSVMRLTSQVQSTGSQSQTQPSDGTELIKKRRLLVLSRVRLFETPWTVARQAPPSVGVSSQEHWSGLPSPSPGDLPDPGIKPGSPALQADSLPSETHLLIIFVDEPCGTRKRERTEEIKQIKQRHLCGQVRSAHFRDIKMIESIEQPCALGQVY